MIKTNFFNNFTFLLKDKEKVLKTLKEKIDNDNSLVVDDKGLPKPYIANPHYLYFGTGDKELQVPEQYIHPIVGVWEYYSKFLMFIEPKTMDKDK